MKLSFYLLKYFIFSLLILSSARPQWEYLNSPQNINDMLILSDGKILVGTNEGLFTSEDNGNSWDSTSLLTNTKLIKKDNIGNIYSASGFMYRSSDEGESWIICDSFPAPYPKNFFINDSNNIYTIEDIASVTKSTNQGLSWTWLYQLAMSGGVSDGITEHSGEVYFSYLIFNYSIKELDKIDLNGNFTIVLENIEVLNIYFLNDTMYLATSGEGIYKSYDDGLTLIPINNGLTNNVVKQIILTPEVFLCLAGNGIYRSLDEGNY